MARASMLAVCLTAGLAAGLALPACGSRSKRIEPFRPPLLVAPEGPEAGRLLYLRDCAWCHGKAGEGTGLGPNLVSETGGRALAHFMLSTGRMPIGAPTDPLVHRPPAYPANQIEAIVNYVGSLGGSGPDIPEVDPSAGDLSLGEILYQENCAACHSTTGVGGALTPGRSERPSAVTGRRSELVAPSLNASKPVEIAEAMRVGPGTMPVFGEETFSDREVDSIVRYVLELADPNNRGGAAIGKIGPVAEGAVALLVGLGILLLVSRRIGTRVGED